MNFLMINSPLYREPWEQYDEVLPPIWLWYICTDLKNKWVDVELFDAVAWKISLEQIVNYIENWNFNNVWLNIFSTNHQLVQEIVTRISKKITFFIGWAFTKTNAQDIINWNTNNEINVIIWEADKIVFDILSWTLLEDPIYRNWNKKIFRVNKDSIYFPNEISDLKIDRTFFKYEPTINVQNWKKEWNIVVSRWCIYNCAFCSAAVSLNPWNKARIRTSESVKEEILQIKKLHPEIESIRILDDLFLRNINSILEAINIFSWLGLTWRAMAHIQSFKDIEEDILIEMKKSWCNELSIWIESWNNKILKFINKNNTVNQIKETIEKIFKTWIWVKWYFILWFPWETEYQFKSTYNLAKYIKDLSLKYKINFRISVFQFRPYHWTKLYYDLINQWYEIKNIEADKKFWLKTIWEYDFWNWNFSNCNEDILKKFIIKIRNLNDK